MSIEAIAHTLSLDVGDSTRKLVLIGYANHAHKDGTAAYASIPTIAEYANCTSRTVQRHVKALVETGFLREGDQRLVAHYRADRRPIVYDVALSEEARAEWAAAEAGSVRVRAAQNGLVRHSPERGDSESPRESEARGDTRGANGVTPVTERGDMAMSPKPSSNRPSKPTDDSLRSSSAPLSAAEVHDTATGLAQAWWEFYQSHIGPVVRNGKGSPFIALRDNVVKPALEAGWTENEIKIALKGPDGQTPDPVPSKAMFQRRLAEARNGRASNPRSNVHRLPTDDPTTRSHIAAFGGNHG